MLTSKILPEDITICLLDESNPYQSITPPILQTSLFEFKTFADYQNYLQKKHKQHAYTRGSNPTTSLLEEKLARLERGECCQVFSSGMAAVSAAIISHLKTGDHILFVNTIYAPTMLYAEYLKKFNISYTYLRQTDTNSIQANIQENTKMIYLESPGSVDLGLVDICAVTSLAKERSILTVLDNTYSTPLFQKPLELGIDISIHSCTKYIGGHADVMAGAVITSRKLMKNIFEFGFKLHGAVLSPHDAFLLLRGLRTLPSRLQSLQQITIDVVNFLQRHERVLKVNHPLAYSDSDQLIFKQQASGYTGLLSVELDVDNFTELGEIIDKLTLFPLGFSWGGYENLVVAPYANGDFTELRSQGLTPNLVRFSLGLFDSSSIIADLAQALQR